MIRDRDRTGAQAVTHDALREIDLSRVDHARAGIMNGPVRFQHGLTIGTPPLVRADAQGQHIDAGSTQGARIMICGIAGPLTRRKQSLLVGVTTLAFSPIFRSCGSRRTYPTRPAQW